MTTLLCSGLAVLGLCLPLPGHSFEALSQAGWPIKAEDGEDIVVSTVSSGSLRVAVSVKFVNGVVASVLLLDTSKEQFDGDSRPLDSAVASVCRTQGGKESCVVNGLVFERFPCAGGWLLARRFVESNRARTESQCMRWGRLFGQGHSK